METTDLVNLGWLAARLELVGWEVVREGTGWTERPLARRGFSRPLVNRVKVLLSMTYADFNQRSTAVEGSSLGEPSKTPRRRIRIALQLTMLALTLFWIFRTIEVKQVLKYLSEAQLGIFGSATLLYAFSLVVGAFRLWLLLLAFKPQRKPALHFCLSLTFVGFFFNALPSSVIGEGVKAFRLARLFCHPAIAYVAVILDKVVGLLGLLTLGGLFLVIVPWQGEPFYPMLIWILLAVTAAVALGIVLLPELASSLPWLASRLLKTEDLSPLRRRPNLWILLVTLGLSVVTNSLLLFSIYLFIAEFSPGLAFAAGGEILTLVMISNIFMLTPAGMGQRESSFIFFLAMVGICADRAVTISMLHFLTHQIIILIGALFYLASLREIKGD